MNRHTAARHAGWLPTDALLPAAASLLAALILFFFIRSPPGMEHCACGVALGKQTIPDLRGPDRPSRGPVLEVSPGETRLNRAVVPELELASMLGAARHGQNETPPVSLKAHRDLEASDLWLPLVALSIERFSLIHLVVREVGDGFYQPGYTSVGVILVPEERLPEGERIWFWKNPYEDLVKAAIKLRRGGTRRVWIAPGSGRSDAVALVGTEL